MTETRVVSGRILLVEDDLGLSHLVRTYLEREGFVVEACGRGDEALTRIPEFRPDLVVLDIDLPGFDGREVCRRLRLDPDTESLPIVMVTGMASESDRVTGFELGADDYVPKPVSPRELTLRVRALLRRTRSQPPLRPSQLSLGRVRVELDRKEAEVDGQPVELTSTEFRLLAYLMQRSPRVVPRTELLQRVWGTRGSLTTRRVDTYVQRLRAKIGAAGAQLHTHRGHGYSFEAP